MAAIHVVPHSGEWAVKREGEHDSLSVHRTQDEAAEKGRRMAREERTEFILRGGDGEIRSRDSYGNDPRDVPG